jgi:hypothetical protein
MPSPLGETEGTRRAKPDRPVYRDEISEYACIRPERKKEGERGREIFDGGD